ncbi:PREDICTED: mesothelin-like [Galeopterus variegatus]|uniref:Mesothelin-like n=1 Tax=Galeopterus variegatus TaxID=482537 RepID=A0ABM0QKB4_GALVR|nr:PREDICTED: mesothelin-like [Galeopterus variegatus]
MKHLGYSSNPHPWPWDMHQGAYNPKTLGVLAPDVLLWPGIMALASQSQEDGANHGRLPGRGNPEQRPSDCRFPEGAGLESRAVAQTCVRQVPVKLRPGSPPGPHKPGPESSRAQTVARPQKQLDSGSTCTLEYLGLEVAEPKVQLSPSSSSSGGAGHSRRGQQALCPQEQEAESLDQAVANVSDFASLSPGLLLGFTCVIVSDLSAERVQELAIALGKKNVTLHADQLRCLARRLSEHRVPEDLDTFPLDMLLFLDPAAFPGPQACAHFFSRVSKANVDVLPQRAPERQRLLPAALACLGVRGSRVSKADVQALGGLACDLPGHFVAHSAEALLPRLAGCSGPLDQDQQEAARVALQGGGPPYGPPSRWSVSTLEALQGLLPLLDQTVIHSIPKGVMTAWLQRTYRDPYWQWPEQRTVVLPRLRRDTKKGACPPGREVRLVDVELVLYEEWEMEACVHGALLATQMDRVNMMPFTYQQLDLFKRKLDEIYPQGYPESLIQRLSYFFLRMRPEDIYKWNVTSLEMVKDLIRVSKGRKMDAQVAALIARYVAGRGQLDKDTLDALATFRPMYLCFLSPTQLDFVKPSVLWAVGPQDLDACSPRQLDLLYPKAHFTFQNMSGQEYFMKVKYFLGGAPTEDLQALSEQNVNMDIATFKTLRKDAVVRLTVAEVQNLLGPHLAGLKAEEENSPVRDWVSWQPQEALDSLGLGLRGGVPNGYFVLDLDSREALSRGSCHLGPGPALFAIPALLPAWTLS